MPRLLVQADDNALSHGVTIGILDAITNGIVRNTGLFTNQPAAAEAAHLLRERAGISVGLDVNLVTGSPLCRPADIPDLVTVNGSFRTSGDHLAAQPVVRTDGWIVVFEEDPFPLHQVRLETRAQIERFTDLMGRRPDYLHFHSLATPNVDLVVREIAVETGIPVSLDVLTLPHVRMLDSSWYTRPFPLDAQAAVRPEKAMLDAFATLTANDTGVLITHPGYVDADLLDLSTFSLVRARDLQALTAPPVLAWLADHDVQLVTYRDLSHSR